MMYVLNVFFVLVLKLFISKIYMLIWWFNYFLAMGYIVVCP